MQSELNTALTASLLTKAFEAEKRNQEGSGGKVVQFSEEEVTRTTYDQCPSTPEEVETPVTLAAPLGDWLVSTMKDMPDSYMVECDMCQKKCLTVTLQQISNCGHQFCSGCMALLTPYYRSHVWGLRQFIPHQLVCLCCRDSEVRLWDSSQGRGFLETFPEAERLRINETHAALKYKEGEKADKVRWRDSWEKEFLLANAGPSSTIIC
jgi:hypothetical protein